MARYSPVLCLCLCLMLLLRLLLLLLLWLPTDEGWVYARVKANQALIAESRICRVGPHRNSNPKIKHSTQKNEPCVGSSSRKTKHFVSSRSPFLPQTSIHSAVKYQFHPSIHPSIHPVAFPFHPCIHPSIHPFAFPFHSSISSHRLSIHPVIHPCIHSSYPWQCCLKALFRRVVFLRFRPGEAGLLRCRCRGSLKLIWTAMPIQSPLSTDLSLEAVLERGATTILLPAPRSVNPMKLIWSPTAATMLIPCPLSLHPRPPTRCPLSMDPRPATHIAKPRERGREKSPFGSV